MHSFVLFEVPSSLGEVPLSSSQLWSVKTTLPNSRSALLYRATCPKCRFLSRLAMRLSFGTLDRFPLDSRQADKLLARRPRPTKFAVIRGDSLKVGWTIVPALATNVFRQMMFTNIGRLKLFLNREQQRNSACEQIQNEIPTSSKE